MQKATFFKFLILPLLFILFSPQQAKADHIAGGSISWECDTNGLYIFKMTVYQDCQKTIFSYSPQVLDVFNGPRPRNSNGGVISAFILHPDSNKWNRYNQGDMRPDCQPTPNRPRVTCSNGDAGLLQAFFYKSHPIELRGTPPSIGWRFAWTAPCCRKNLNNLYGTTPILQATLYANGPNSSPCIDNSPSFSDDIKSLYCRQVKSYNSYSTIDSDGDSLVYSLSQTFDTPASQPRAVNYFNNYSFDNPTPDTSFNSSNIPFTLDTTNGEAFFAVYNGVFGASHNDYHIAVKVHAFRNGNLVSENDIEYPIHFVDCQLTNIFSGVQNSAPSIGMPFNQGTSFSSSVQLGNTITANLSIVDTNTINGQSQNIALQIISNQISSNYRFGGPCPLPSDSNCAYVTTLASLGYDSAAMRNQLEGLRSINGIFRWTPDCGDLGPNNTAKTHYFTLKAKDFYCPAPAVNYKVMAITVLPDPNNPCNLATDLSVHENETDFEIYPNPSSGHVNFNFKLADDYRIRLIDLQGRVWQENMLLNQKQFNLELSAPAGLYLLEIQNKSGKHYYKRIIVM